MLTILNTTFTDTISPGQKVEIGSVTLDLTQYTGKAPGVEIDPEPNYLRIKDSPTPGDKYFLLYHNNSSGEWHSPITTEWELATKDAHVVLAKVLRPISILAIRDSVVLYTLYPGSGETDEEPWY